MWYDNNSLARSRLPIWMNWLHERFRSLQEQNYLIQWRWWKKENRKWESEREGESIGVASCRLPFLCYQFQIKGDFAVQKRERERETNAQSMLTCRCFGCMWFCWIGVSSARCYWLADDVIRVRGGDQLGQLNANKQTAKKKKKKELSFDDRRKTIERKESFLLRTLYTLTRARMDAHREEPWAKRWIS